MEQARKVEKKKKEEGGNPPSLFPPVSNGPFQKYSYKIKGCWRRRRRMVAGAEYIRGEGVSTEYSYSTAATGTREKRGESKINC